MLKYVLCKIALDEVENLTEWKKQYESDEVLVEKIAKHYELLKYIYTDEDDKKMPRDYNFIENKDKHKYIATAVEALLGAIYLKNKNLDEIEEIVSEWIEIINANS